MVDGTFNPDQWVDAKEQRRMDDFHHLFCRAKQAVLIRLGSKEPGRSVPHGVLIGSGIGGLPALRKLRSWCMKRPSPPVALLHSGPADQPGVGYVSIEHSSRAQPFGGDGLRHRAHAIATRAPDRFGRCRCDGRGRAESAVCRIGIAGFNACRALSTGFNDTPTKASRPYDKDATVS